MLPIRRVEGVEIICIGNITSRGTGKTPAVQYFCKKDYKNGKKVAVVSREDIERKEKKESLF